MSVKHDRVGGTGPRQVDLEGLRAAIFRPKRAGRMLAEFMPTRR